MRAMILLAAACLPTVATAATLRPMTTLNGSQVLLSDLFDDAGPLAARVLGPAPAPGERIVVETRQLAAIARMFGVAWTPVTPVDAAVLERPGRLLPRPDVLEALRPALAGVGAPAGAEIELPDFAPPMVPLRTRPQLGIEQLDYDAGAGRFSAALLITGEAMTPLRLRLTGLVHEMADVVVPAHRLAAGTTLRPADLVQTRLRASAVHGEVAREIADAAGMRLRHAVQGGQPLPLAELQRPGTLEKGASVTMQIELGALSVTARGVALAAGAPGERIPVLNPVSHMVVEGQLQEGGIVVITPGTLPEPAGPQQVSFR